MVEQPFCRLTLSKFAAAVCGRCLRALQANGEVPPPGNPCLPRYCFRCKETPNPLDVKLTPLRMKLTEIAKANEIEPIILHTIVLLDLQRSGYDIGKPPAADMPRPRRDQSFEDVVCSVVDYDSLPNVWDRKPEPWRKRIGGGVRAVHKELTALADAGTIEGYKVSPVTRFQADAAQLVANIQQVAGPGSNTETALGIFPTLSLFQHSCLPNCHFLVLAGKVFVRTLIPVEAGTPLTVSYVSTNDPRSARQAALENERHFTCTCHRCIEPMATSYDRLLEGVICMQCQLDVLLPLPEGPETEKAVEDWKEIVAKSKAEIDARAAAKPSKKAGKSRAGKKAPALTNGAEASKEETPAGEGGSAAGESAAAEGVAAEGAEPVAEVSEGEAAEQAEQAVAVKDDNYDGIVFWRCCGCQAVQPNANTEHSGPGDVTNQAARMLQQGMTFVNVKHPEVVAQGEALLEAVAQGMDNRLSIYHNFVLAAQMPLININLRKGEALKVMNFAVQVWNVDRELQDNRPSIQQLQCLEAIVEAAEAKASSVNSAVIKKQLEKKVKQAKDELKVVRPILLGSP